MPVATAALPAVPAGFTGREEDLARLMPVLDRGSAESDLPVVICAVSGLGGIGKTSLALCAAHRAVREGWFPGGTLFVDLRGYDEDPVTADQAVVALLDVMGVRGAELPQTVTAQQALYQRLLAEQRQSMLLILDNASDPSQVAALFPATNHHRVLITSRDRLSDLDVRLLDLDVLKPAASADLIERSLQLADESDDRAAREPEAVAELAELCGHHPLALRIAGGMLRKRWYRGIRSLVLELRQSEDRAGTLGARPILEAAYSQLPQEQARLLRLLCLAPTAEVSDEAAMALAGQETEQTALLLSELASSRLVTPVPSDGGVRWRLHDLVRAFGAHVVTGDPNLHEEGESARERLLEFYGQTADAADDQLRWLPQRKQGRFTDRAQALTWLDGERAGLMAAAQWAEDDRHASAAVWLASCLSAYLEWRRYFDDWITIARTAQEAARRTGDPGTESSAWDLLGLALREAGRVEEAVAAHTHARDLYQAAHDRDGEANALNNLGIALREAGKVEEAIVALTRARDLHRVDRGSKEAAETWGNLGNALEEAGRVQEAIDAHTRSRDMFQDIGHRHGEGGAWHNLGSALQEAGRTKEAVKAYGEALKAHREFEDWYRTGHSLFSLAVVRRAQRRISEARKCYLRASDAYTRANAPTEATEAQSAAESLT
ncbi:tetratricopeptide repeat protein [Streptomyces sp. WM6386]|uniref:tetratricopeptide repeat protein n=1 Tax=Streptomyces sp. WM6386 TaxID=1415558 RepID=UPI002D21935B|nr:tetratricopeptide repeat protein [Streptomyces sp. WM6386]